MYETITQRVQPDLNGLHVRNGNLKRSEMQYTFMILTMDSLTTKVGTSRSLSRTKNYSRIDHFHCKIPNAYWGFCH